MQIIFRRLGTLLVTLMLVSGSAYAESEDPASFFENKTIRIMSTTGSGGTMDLYLLLFMKYAQNYFPESTDLVLDHRPGAGGVVGTNYLYNSAPRDGTTFGMPIPGIVTTTFSFPENVRYEPSDFIGVGRLVDLPRVYVSRSDSGIASFDDLIGSDSAITHGVMTPADTAGQFAKIAIDAVDANLRVVPGYSSGGDMFLAMEQGEVMSTTAEPGNLLSNKWHLVENGEINVLGYLGLEPIAGLDTDNLLDHVDQDIPEYAIAEAIAQTAAIGLSLILPPEVPEDRVAYLRDVFEQTMTDPDLLAEAEERNIPVNFADGDYLTDIIRDSADVTPEVRQWFEEISEL